MTFEYRSFHQLCWTHKLIYRDANYWRMVNPPILGAINALPQSRGFLLATNGILCLIETLDSTIYEGHIQHFAPDSSLDEDQLDEVKSGTRKKPEEKKQVIDPADYRALLGL